MNNNINIQPRRPFLNDAKNMIWDSVKKEWIIIEKDNSPEIYCWKCGTKFKIGFPERIDWHSKMCPDCGEKAYDIFDKYGWEHIPVTGCACVIGLREKIPWKDPYTDYMKIAGCGFKSRYKDYRLKKKKYSHLKEIWEGPPDLYPRRQPKGI